MRKLLRISYLEHKTNDWVWSKINLLVGPQEPLLATVKRRKLAWFGQVTRHDSLSKTILQGTLDSGCRRGRQRKCWTDNIKERTSLTIPVLLMMVSRLKNWKRVPANLSLKDPPTTKSRERLNWTVRKNLFFSCVYEKTLSVKTIDHTMLEIKQKKRVCASKKDKSRSTGTVYILKNNSKNKGHVQLKSVIYLTHVGASQNTKIKG